MKRLLLMTFLLAIGTLSINAQDLQTSFAAGPTDQVTTTVSDFEIGVNTYPNPTESIVNVESKSIINTIVIYNINGSVIKTINNVNDYKTVIDFNTFDTGIYFINVNGKVNKILKQ